MSTPDFDQAVLRQALRQTLSHVLDVTLDDQNVNLLRDHPAPYFAPRNTGGTFDSTFLSSPHAPPFQLGYSHPSSSLSRPFAGKNSDNILLAAVLAERRRVQAALLGKQQMLTHQAQKRHALLTQQKQQDAYSTSFLQSMLAMQSMRPSPPPPPPSTVPSTSAELWQAHGPAAVTDPSNVLTDPTKVLKVLGSNLRGKSDPYIDVSRLAFTKEQEPQMIRGGVTDPFPQKLYRMLEEVEEQGKAHIISFHPHGRALSIHNMEAFTNEILPKYFVKQSKLVSFVRQLNLYGFVRIHSGPDLGGYYHELFLKGRPELSEFMRRTGASIGDEDRRKRKDRNVPAIQPNFYAMQPIRPSHEH
jgi:hypothetical protein